MWIKEVNEVDMMARLKIERLEQVVRANGLDQIHQDNSIINVLNVVSLNQKRVMTKLELPYMSPEKVEGLLGGRTQ